MILPPAETLAAASAVDASAGAPFKDPRRIKILPVLFVLILGIPLRPIVRWGPAILPRFGWSSPTIGVRSIVIQATIAIIILLVVHFWERLPMRSVGIVRFAASDLTLGVAAFVGICVIEGIALPLVLSFLTGSRDWGIASIDARQLALIDKIPWPLMLAVAASAGIFEEIWARGYAVERLEALTGSTLAAAAIALALDLGAHVPFWGFRYPVLIAPGQILLLSLYLWRRRLAPCVIAHFLWDSGRPIVFAALWLLAIAHPVPALRGELALSIGDYDQSIAEFSTALRNAPDNVLALEGRSNAYLHQGKYDQAIDDLTKVIKLKPGSEYAYQSRADSYYDKRDYPRAMADANQAIKLAPNKSGLYSMRAYVDAAIGDQKTELQDLDHAIRLDPGDRDALSLRASLHSDHGEYDQAIEDYSHVLKNNPDDTGALGGRATAYWYRSNFNRSISDLTKVIELEPNNEWAYWNRANSYLAKDDYPRAMADADEAIKLVPNDSGTYSMRAYINAASGDKGGAIKDLGQAIKLAPRDHDMLERREALYYESGDFDDAIADLGHLLTLDPSNSDLLSQRAALYETRGQFAMAARDAAAIISAHPKNPTGYTVRANLSYTQHRYGAALDDLNRAIAIAPDRTDLYQWRAVAYTKLGKTALAIADWRRALAKPPKTAADYNGHAWTLATCPLSEVRNGKQAVEFATRACNLNGWKNGEYLDTLAAASAEQGDFADAIGWEKQAIAAITPGQKTTVAGMRERLALYQAGHPYRDSYPSLFRP